MKFNDARSKINQLLLEADEKDTLIKQLAEENERLREALGMIDHILVDDESSYHIWEIAYKALNAPSK